jgi:hypothetical protein
MVILAQCLKWLKSRCSRLRINTSRTPAQPDPTDPLRQVLLREIDTMPLAAARAIVTHFSRLMQANAQRRQLGQLEHVPLPRNQAVARGPAGVGLPYTREQAIVAFKTYYVGTDCPDSAHTAMSTLLLRVSEILPDDLDEPTALEDLVAHLKRRDDLWRELVAQQAGLETLRAERHGQPRSARVEAGHRADCPCDCDG